MINPFCRLLSNGYSFSVSKKLGGLTLSPCCLFTSKIKFDTSEYYQSKKNFNNITGWTESCHHCHNLEKSGQQSLRQTGKDWISDHVTEQSAVMIDINLDIECNAACVICSDKFSSLWQKENNKLQGFPIDIEKSTNLVDDYIQSITNNVPLNEVTYVKFFGGEPLFTDTHLKFLEKIPYPEKVTVHYTTNGSIFPKSHVIDVWQKFKTIVFAASIDGVEKQFDYVRWPLTWDKVSSNLIKLKEASLHNVMFRVEFTANFLNTFYFDRLEQWIKNNFSSNVFGDPTEVNIHDCVNSPFSLDHMPENLRCLIMEKYPQNHVIHGLVKNLANNRDLVEFYDFVYVWDVRRQLHWQDCFSEIVDHISKS